MFSKRFKTIRNFTGRKLLLLSLLLILGESAFSQIRVGIKAGLNLADMKYEPKNQTSGTPNTHSLPSFNAGIIADIPLIEGLALQPGLMLEGKGSKVEESGNSWSYTQTMNPLYVSVPVNILFKPEIGKDTKLYFGFGPYFAWGIGGKATFSGNIGNLNGSTDHTLQFGNDSGDDLKTNDIGANILGGFEFSKGLLVGAQYGISITNNAPNSSNNANKILRNKVFSFSVGYLFGK